jgi:hypothetical protein
MTTVNLLVVERNADWSQWSTISRSLSAVLMLVQQPDETNDAFHARILKRVANDRQLLDRVVLLRARGTAEDGGDELNVKVPWLEHIGATARGGLRVYPEAATA